MYIKNIVNKIYTRGNGWCAELVYSLVKSILKQY